MLSSLQKRWRLADPPQETVDRLVRELNVTPTLARLLINRRVETADDARFFLENDLSRLHDPFLMKGMDAAAERVLRAIENREKITAFCDYDVDGVTSAAFLIHFFRDLGVEIDDYLPERLREGYGLNAQAIHEIHSRGTRLIITADCGITAVEEVRTARALGVDVIISDHHQVGPQGLPEAVAVLNPHRSDCTYPYRFLSGVGIALKLAQAVRSRLLAAGWDRERLPNLKRHLDLFALGTIADVAPLTGENHLLSALGLEVMTVSAKPGLIALKEVAGVTGAVTARSVGFGLGPRLNAAGRLGKADAGLHLLISPDLREAMELAAVLDRTNQERKDVQERVLEEAEYLMEREVNLEKDRVIVLASENFHPGVVGIAASRLVEKYFRPTVLIALEGEVGKGSGRSIPRFNLHKAFIECASHLVQFGGHAYAAGLTIRKDCVPHFRDAMNRVGERILQPEDLIPEMKI
ncbi:MAG: single-stranded-DNA-specific exonuclease RecJ, partial [Nitrospinae bacterium CG11_big_fil_rev_8_21_14_0_20_56_8]